MCDPAKLLELYKQLWNNRSLAIDKRLSEEEALIEVIKTELKDELTHPRTRKKPLEKYFLAVKRITSSNIEPSEQVSLIRKFNEVLEGLC